MRILLSPSKKTGVHRRLLTAPSLGHTAGQWIEQRCPSGNGLQCSEPTACQTQFGLNERPLEAHMVIDGHTRCKWLEKPRSPVGAGCCVGQKSSMPGHRAALQPALLAYSCVSLHGEEMCLFSRGRIPVFIEHLRAQLPL